MSKIDLVLLHAPSVYDFRERSIMFGPVSDVVPSTPIFEMYPLGFTTMAEHLERNGREVRIVNLAVLMLNNPRFDVDAAIRDMDPVAFGIDLHWLPHAHGSVEVARIVKRHHPATPVIFGGLSASFFHEELAGYDCVDYVLRGDSAEEPLRLLLDTLEGNGDLAGVPNLTWKSPDGSIVSNPIDWVPSHTNDIPLDYSYNMRSVIRYRDIMGALPFKGWLEYPVCAALSCHGCSHSCVTCGGSAYSFREHFGRDRVAFRDPELLVADIQSTQRYVPGPIFILNDFTQAGPDYAQALVRGLSKLKLRSAVGFEFFKPPSEDFYEFLDAHLTDYSVEISVDSHDDAVRAAAGKPSYTMRQVEESVCAALRHGCGRFDLYFMAGIPTQTAASVRDTVGRVRGIYEMTGNDPRFMPFLSPMAPFLDPGSMAFDDPARHGYRLLANTLEEHRQLLLQPSWRHIMNYESDSMPRAELVSATYETARGINRTKSEVGAVRGDVASATEARIRGAEAVMMRIDRIVAGDSSLRESALEGLRQEVVAVNESTVCEKSELEWPVHADPRTVLNVAGLWVRENVAMLTGHRRFDVVNQQPAAPSVERAEP